MRVLLNDEHLLHILTDIEQKLEILMSDQEHLNADVAALTAALAEVEAEVAALKAQPQAQALDFTGLDAAVARIQGDAPPAPTA